MLKTTLKIVRIFNSSDGNSEHKNIHFSAMYSVPLHGEFIKVEEESEKLDWDQLKNLPVEKAQAIVNLANQLYAMGYNRAQREIAAKLGLL